MKNAEGRRQRAAHDADAATQHATRPPSAVLSTLRRSATEDGCRYRGRAAEDGLRRTGNTPHAPRPRRSGAFTLIELLVVLSVIAILAALTFPAITGAKISVLRSRARAELTQVESVIEAYHQKLGYYPPDNKIAGNRAA